VRARVFEFKELIVNISWHADAVALGGIIPFDIRARHFIPRHDDLHAVVLLEKIKEIVEVFSYNVFNAKVVNNQAKLDKMPFVVPKAWRGGSFIVAFSNGGWSKKIVGKDAGLGKTLTPLANFRVNPTIMVSTQEVYQKCKTRWCIWGIKYRPATSR
jgi:hypothetical protein